MGWKAHRSRRVLGCPMGRQGGPPAEPSGGVGGPDPSHVPLKVDWDPGGDGPPPCFWDSRPEAKGCPGAIARHPASPLTVDSFLRML